MIRSERTPTRTQARVFGFAAAFFAATYATLDAGPPTVTLQAKLETNFFANPADADEFGKAVDVDGDTAAAGVPGDDYDVMSNLLSDAGSVEVYVRSGTTWSLQAVVKAPDAQSGDRFGAALALDGDRLYVGAPGDDHSGWNSAGSVYVFERSGTTWSFDEKIIPDVNANDAEFGASIDLSGDQILIGAPRASVPFSLIGAAFLFERTGTTYVQQHTFASPSPTYEGGFGIDVSIDGNTVAIGAPYHLYAIGPTILAGKVYVYRWSGSFWSTVPITIVAAETANSLGGSIGDKFGICVELQGDTLVVGAPNHSPGGIGAAGAAGAAYVFQRTGFVWMEQKQLLAASPIAWESFGSSIAFEGDRVFIGAPGSSFASLQPGAIYAFDRSGMNWTQKVKIAQPEGSIYFDFGGKVAMDGTTLIAGAIRAPGSVVAGFPGVAYVFDVTAGSPWDDLGSALAGSGGAPQLAGTGTLIPGSPGSLVLSNAAPSAAALVAISFASTPTPFLGGTLVPFPFSSFLVFTTDGTGGIALPWAAWPAGIPTASNLYFQYVVQDATGPVGVTLSNALRATTP